MSGDSGSYPQACSRNAAQVKHFQSDYLHRKVHTGATCTYGCRSVDYHGNQTVSFLHYFPICFGDAGNVTIISLFLAELGEFVSLAAWTVPCQTMENTQRQLPMGSAIRDGVHLRHLARPEVLAQVRARCSREHEMTRRGRGAPPADHQRCVGCPCVLTRLHGEPFDCAHIQHSRFQFSDCHPSRVDGVPQPAVDSEIDDCPGGSGDASLESHAS